MVAISSSCWLDFCAVPCSCSVIRGYCPAPLYEEEIFGLLKLNPVIYPTFLCGKVSRKYSQKTGMWFWRLEQIPAVSEFNRNFVKQAINLLLLIISALCSQSRNVMEWALQLLVNYVRSCYRQRHEKFVHCFLYVDHNCKWPAYTGFSE
jgi:hypothetical protein